MNEHFQQVCSLFGQSTNYFQQQVDHDIKIVLDTLTNTLHGVQRIYYTNNSPDEIASIPFHLWANAYSKKTSQFAKQQLNMKRTDFHF